MLGINELDGDGEQRIALESPKIKLEVNIRAKNSAFAKVEEQF